MEIRYQYFYCYNFQSNKKLKLNCCPNDDIQFVHSLTVVSRSLNETKTSSLYGSLQRKVVSQEDMSQLYCNCATKLDDIDHSVQPSITQLSTRRLSKIFTFAMLPNVDKLKHHTSYVETTNYLSKEKVAASTHKWCS